MRRFIFLIILFFSAFYVNSIENYFNSEYLNNILKNLSHNNTENIIFNRSELGDLYVYNAKQMAVPDVNLYQYYLMYDNYTILLLTEKIDSSEYVKDYLMIKKQNPDTHLTSGAVEINNTCFDWEITVVVNSKWVGTTSDISEAFKIDILRKKIYKIEYDSIKIFSES